MKPPPVDEDEQNRSQQKPAPKPARDGRGADRRRAGVAPYAARSLPPPTAQRTFSTSCQKTVRNGPMIARDALKGYIEDARSRFRANGQHPLSID